VYKALARIPRKFPARLLRTLKEHVYKLVKDNGPQSQLSVKDIDDDSNVADLQVVFGVGLYKNQEPEKVVLSEDPGAKPVRLTEDPSAPMLPFRTPDTSDKYSSLQEALVGAVRAWRTDPKAYTSAAQLWWFYSSRSESKLDDDTLRCLLISSMHHNCPFHFWAYHLSRKDLLELLKEEVELDLYPRIRCAARLAFALGMSYGKQILQDIERKSKYGSVRTLAERLEKSLEKGEGVIVEYRSPRTIRVTLEGEEITVSTSSIFEDKQKTSMLISQLAAQAQNNDEAKKAVKQLDPKFYGLFP
jgi:hypothetical protein